MGDAGAPSLCLTHPTRILAKELLNRGSREAPAGFYKVPAPCRVSQSLCFPPRLGRNPSLPPQHLCRVGALCSSWCGPGAPQLFQELVGLGGCKQDTDAPWKSSVLVRGFGTTGCHRVLGSWPHCGPVQNKCAVFWTSSFEEALLLQKSAHVFFSGWE